MVSPPSRGSCLLLSPIVPLLLLILGPPMLGLGLMRDLCGTWVGPMLVQVGLLGAMLGPCCWCWYIPVGFTIYCPFCFSSPNSVLQRVLRSCLPLSPHMCTFVGRCARLLEVLSPRVSQCLPTCVPLFDGVTAFPRPCLPACLLSLVSRLVSQLGWRVRLPEALPPLSPSLFPSLSPNFSPACLPTCLPAACLPACPPSCFVLQLVSELLSQHVSQLVFLLVCFAWMVCPPCQGLGSIVSQPVPELGSHLVSQLVSRLSPSLSRACLAACFPACLVFLLVFLCRIVCPPSRGLVSLVSQLVFPSSLPTLSPSLFPFVGWCAHPPDTLSPLSPSLSASLSPTCLPAFLPACLPSCLPLLDGVLVSHLVFPLVSQRLPACLPACSLFLSSFPLWRVVSFCILGWFWANLECALLVWSCSPAWKLWAPGLRMMSSLTCTTDVFDTNLTILCCLIECLDPHACTPSDVSFIVF